MICFHKYRIDRDTDDGVIWRCKCGKEKFKKTEYTGKTLYGFPIVKESSMIDSQPIKNFVQSFIYHLCLSCIVLSIMLFCLWAMFNTFGYLLSHWRVF